LIFYFKVSGERFKDVITRKYLFHEYAYATFRLHVMQLRTIDIVRLQRGPVYDFFIGL